MLPLAAAALGASTLPWEDLTPADILYAVTTRTATIEGHEVHYPTPTAELARQLEGRPEPEAWRQLAEARFALGERDAALATLERWAAATGAEAWDEAACWAAERLEMAFAFRAAEAALGAGLSGELRAALLAERIRWADRHPELADALALRAARAQALPEDAEALEDWVDALEKAGRIDEAERSLDASRALDPARRVLLRSDLFEDRKDPKRAFEVLDGALAAPVAPEVRQAYARRTDAWNRELPDQWRATLEARFEASALLRLASYFQGHGRGDKAALLLSQVERRYEDRFDRAAFLLLARLHGEVDSVPEAFRAALGAAQLGTPEERVSDLPDLARLALRAGSRPLAWGRYNEEAYRWLARIDRTPGFWTGGLSFLLTGQDWSQALARLEAAALPDRTFEAARLLVAELERRAPEHAELAPLRVALMERYVGRGEGGAALELLARVESATPAVADEGRRVALLAMRQIDAPLEDELRLFRARLRFLAADGSRPSLRPAPEWQPDWSGSAAGDRPWRRRTWKPAPPSYRDVLNEAAGRMDRRDGSHRTSVSLFLAEMDRLPDAEELWLDLARRLEAWNLDEDLGPRYELAVQRFAGPEWWARVTRYYARRQRHADLRRLARDLASRFRGSALFERAAATGVRLELPEQPAIGARVRLAPFADLVRLQALERFPHSPRVVAEALGHLERRSRFDGRLRQHGAARMKAADDRVVVDDDLLERRRWAVFFVDPQRREEYFGAKMRAGALESALSELEARPQRTPVEDQLLFEGWSRLSRFESAAAPAGRLAAAYPGDAGIARRALSLHRSLAGLDLAHAAPARALVERSAPGLVDPTPLWTEFGELLEDRGDPKGAAAAWLPILDREPRNPQRISELATLLWDYHHMPEALAVLSRGRERLGRPRFMAFEAGVLREETHDIEGAVREYLAALEPEFGRCFCSAFEEDQRSLRRLAQLVARERVFAIVSARLEALRPGNPDDEATLAAFLPLATIRPPAPGLGFDADAWVDAMDLPHDRVGRAQRDAARAASRTLENDAIARIAERILAKAEEMTPRATAAAFIEALERWAVPLLEARSVERTVTFQDSALARRAALAPSEEERITRETERARFLVERGRRAASDALWAELASRVRALPESAAKLQAEADFAGYLERTRGEDAAAAEWRALSERHPWSLGILEDRLAFYGRAGRDEDARSLLEAVAPQAGDGRREALLERLVRLSLEKNDLPRARRGVELLLDEKRLDDAHRLGALHLLTRLRLKEDPLFDPLPLGNAEAPRVQLDHVPDLYAQLARAADVEGAGKAALALWIEALNRRLDRGFLAEAARAAERASKGIELRTYFERQQERSPRDVRWAVAVRELRRHQDDVEGAVAMAKAAVAIRPERESLWREAADLLVRADRVREAADYLEGWNRPRAADEGVAAWRGSLFASAGDAERALAVERAALASYEKETALTKERREELEARRARAARRLIGFGHPSLAWRLVAPAGDVSRLATSGLGESEQAGLAIAVGHLPALLRSIRSESFFRAAGAAFRERSRTEDQDEVRAFLASELWPPAGTSVTALRRFWPFVEESGLERAVRLALAERYVSARPGPWDGAPVAFLETVGAEVVEPWTPGDGGIARLRFGTPKLDRLWIHDLVRRDQAQALGAFLAPRLDQALATARADTPLEAANRALLDWARALDRDALEGWARQLRREPGTLAALDQVFSKRRSWDRFWALAARAWDTAPLVALLSEDARFAWFRFWEPKAPTPERQTLAHVGRLVGRLVQADAAATADALLVKLRGPRTVGDVLGRDAAWLFAELGAREPELLWGGRPGEGWWALEILARVRAGEKDASLLPMEFPERGRESERTRLGAALAEREGDLGLAVEILDAHAGTDVVDLDTSLRLLVKLGRADEAATRFAKAVRRRQPSLEADALRALEALAEDLKLPPPLESFDADTPLRPALLAYLHDLRGPEAAARFRAADASGFRAALAARFAEREDALQAPQVRYWLSELWARGAAAMPSRGLRRLGGLWSRAGAWLAAQAVVDRAEALAAVDALPEAGRFDAFVRARGQDLQEATRLLRLRAALARGDDTFAAASLDGLLVELRGEAPLAYAPAAVSSDAEDEAGASGGALDEEGFAWADEAESEPAEDALVARLETWLAPFREAGRAAAAEARVAELLREKRAAGPVTSAAWSQALRLAPDEAARARLDRELEHAWLRGDFEPDALAPLVEALARFAPALAPRWLARWPESIALSKVAARARLLERLRDPEAAARVLVAARARRGFSAADELRAFDQWRRLGLEPAAASPSSWKAALPFWRRPPAEVATPIGDHLKAHPTDVLVARAALRSLAPAEEGALLRAALALASPTMEGLGPAGSDASVLRLRAARGLLPESGRAARRALGEVDASGLAEDLDRRRFPRKETNAALADVARVLAAAEEHAGVEAMLAVLSDRGSEGIVELRAEIAAARAPEAPRAFRLADGRPAPWRPRDLTFRLVADMLAAEENR